MIDKSFRIGNGYIDRIRCIINHRNARLIVHDHIPKPSLTASE